MPNGKYTVSKERLLSPVRIGEDGYEFVYLTVAEHRTHIVTYYRGEDGEVREAQFCKRKGGLIKQAYYECRTENGMAKAIEYWEEEEDAGN